MTNEEMAQVLDVHAVWLAQCVAEEEIEIQQDDYRTDGEAVRAKENLAQLLRELEATKAGAAALRREQWRPIADAPETSRFGFLAGHAGSRRMDHCFDQYTAVRFLHTHYRELPSPPEGV